MDTGTSGRDAQLCLDDLSERGLPAGDGIMSLLEDAIALAVRAHAGQVDKTGQPYILHLLHLMHQMETEEEMITAVLHDLIEDTPIGLDELREMGLSENVLSALSLLTHNTAAESYDAYIRAIQANPLARRVKLADLTHNMDVRRLPQPLTAQDWGRLEKYRRAWEILAAELPSPATHQRLDAE